MPLELFTSEGRSRIASAIAVPLYMDGGTEMGRVIFARICVEVECTDALLDS